MYDELTRILSKYIGENEASKIVGKLDKRNSSYGSPVSKDGKYTKYTYSQNLNSQPGRYFNTDAKVQFDDYDEFYKKNTPSTVGYHDAFNRVHYPDRGGMTLRELYSLPHEFQHSRTQSSRKGDEELLENIKKHISDWKPKDKAEIHAEGGRTYQRPLYEQIPQLIEIESRLPAGQSLWQTNLGKMFSNLEKALYERKTNPVPEGVDAWTR